MASAPLTYFVSYSRADEAFALKLAERLRAEGVNLWIDQLDIPAGDRWDKAVQAALKSSQGLMVLLSKTSVDSDNVMDEVSYALDESKQVIPVLCGKCEIPFRLRRLQYVDLSADFEAGFPLLLKNLGVKGSPARDPAIAPEKASTASRASGGPGRIPDRGLAEKRRRSLAFVGLGAVAVALAIASLRGCVPPQPPPPQVLQREDVQAALSTAEDIEVEALELTVQANAQPWDSVKSDRQWRRIEELWENAAAPLKVMLDNNRDYLPLRLRVQNRHLEYTNRQVFTSAMYDYRKAFFLDQQPNPKTPAGKQKQCNPEATFADTPAEWKHILEMRQRSLDRLNAVEPTVSFHDQVLANQQNYETALYWATKYHRHSPWYYAIQKAVCATEFAKTAAQSNNPADWKQSATSWRRGIALLENAPDNIPAEIEGSDRKKYQQAKDNLPAWKKQLTWAESQERSM